MDFVGNEERELRVGAFARAAAWFVPIALGLFPISEWFRAQVDLWSLCVYASIVSLLILVLAARSTPQGFWSLSSIYLSVFSLFHFGVVYSFTLAGDSALTNFNTSKWFYSPDVPLAIAVALAGMASFYGCSQLRWRRAPPLPASRADRLGTAAGPAGFLIVVFALAWWFYSAIHAGGPSLLLAAYNEFLRATKYENISLSYFLLGIGMSLLVASPQRGWMRAGFVCFGLWAIIALPLGLRGEVLFPLAGAAALMAKHKQPMSGFKALVGVALALVMIDFLRQLRQFGISGVGEAFLELQPTDALLELGSSLLPTVRVIEWLDSGDPYMNGATYWAPLDRALYHLIPGSTRLDAEDDMRIMNVLVMQRVGPIGFSPIAEAFYNYGRFAVVAFMGITGLLVGWLDRWKATPVRIAAAGAIVFPLLIQIRNTFVSTPSWIVIGLAIVGAVALFEQLRLRSQPR